MKAIPTLLLVLSVSLSATQVFAHAKIKEHTPAIGETVTGSVAELTLNFSKSVRLMTLTLVPLTDAIEFTEETQLDKDQATAFDEPFAKKFSKSVSVGFEPLSAGRWGYHWSAVAKDGHTMRGSGHFTVVAE